MRWTCKAFGYVGVVASVAVFAFGGTAAAAEPARSFKIEMLQRVLGSNKGLPEPGYTRSALTAKIGETVEYEVVITNTGSVPLTFGFHDLICEQISFFPESDPVPPGKDEVHTCSHLLTSTGVWANEASSSAAEFSGGASLGEEASNKVTVEVPAEPGVSVETLQAIRGTGAEYTAWPISGTVGESVNYEAIVKNTGNVAVRLTGFHDAACAFGSFSGPSGEPTLGVHETVTYRCSHLLVKSDVHQVSNTAVVTWEAPPGPPASAMSTVLARVSNSPVCSVPERLIVLRGAGGRRRRPFEVAIASTGIARIAFYLDGRRLKTLKAGRAKRGEFSVTIDPGRLSVGAHRVSVTAIMRDTRCATIFRSGVFVHTEPREKSSKS